MKKTNLASIATLIFFLLTKSIVSNAASVERILFSGDEILYAIPEGFCNVTEEVQGILIKELLDKQKNTGIPKAQLILAPCKPYDEYAGYPWAWVGLQKGAPLSQEKFNEMLAQLLGNQELLDKMNRKILRSNSKAFEELLGSQMSGQIGEQRLLWADDNSALLLTAASGVLDGEIIKENSLTSGTVIDDIYVYTYLYNLEGSPPSPKTMSSLLINNASKIKRVNY